MKSFYGLIFTSLFILLSTNLLAQSIRKEWSGGNKILFVDGNTIHKEWGGGDRLYHLDGNTIREKWSGGDKLYYIDGNTIRKEWSGGDKLWHFDGEVSLWAIICTLDYLQK